MVCRVSFFILSIAACFAFPIGAVAADNCPAVDCDCASLPKEHWRSVCYKEESQLKRQCIANSSQPLGYCLVHGPAAKPLPLAVEMTEVSVLPESKLEQAQENSRQVYWSLRSDFDMFEDFIRIEAYKEAKVVFDVFGKNLDALFSNQRQLTKSFASLNKERKARNLWYGYAGKSISMAESLRKLGLKLLKKRNADNDSSRERALGILALKALRSSSKAFEMAAQSYTSAGADKKAAFVWRDASAVSLAILKYKRAEGAPDSHLNYYSNQVAVRLFRTGYHWQLVERPDDAFNALRDSRNYFLNKSYLISTLLDGYGDTSVAEN
ncbi:MAG: hypothetical protein KTR17_10580 [Cellvibrionaceae bacterium]|nr:hypothetical protein [Cellvibrionaceae bacterium]